MPFYVSHITLTEQGLNEVDKVHSRIEANKKLWEGCGGKLIAWYVVFGDYDYLTITEAPNEKVMAAIALKASRRGRSRFKTLAAIPIEDFGQVASHL